MWGTVFQAGGRARVGAQRRNEHGASQDWQEHLLVKGSEGADGVGERGGDQVLPAL